MDFSWVYDRSTDLITFTISAQNVAGDDWIALGFSDDTGMVSNATCWLEAVVALWLSW